MMSPDAWDSGVLSDLCSLRKETCNPIDCNLEIYVGLEHIESGKFFLKRHGLPKEVKSIKNMFYAGDVIYGKLRPYLDKAVVSTSEGICSTDILVFTPKANVPPSFLAGILHCDKFIQHAVNTTHGVNHPRTSWKSLKDYETKIPPLKEREKIAAVLFKIQQAIEVQEFIIKAAQKLKKSTMQYVFTYGLHGEKTKETEIGRIPESWNKGKLDDLCSLQTTSCIPSRTDKDIYIGLEHIESGSFVIKRYGSPKDVKSSKTIFKKGDLLYGKLRPYLDKAVISNENGICSTDILVLRPHNDKCSWFILGLLHLDRFIHHAVQTTHGVNHPRTSWKAIRDYHIGIPKPNEIERIGKIEDKVTLNESKKSTLQDLFKTMLNKLMTGQMRVKDSDRNLPDQH